MAAIGRILHAVHVSALGVWLGVLIMTAATAAIIFPAMRELAPTLPNYQGYAGPHWRLAAGQVQARVFSAAELVELICFGIAVVTLAAGWGRQRRGAATAARVATMVVLLASLTYRSFIMNPAMTVPLLEYWKAAQAGDNDRAAASLDAFQEFHGLATGLLALDAVAVLTALLAAAWAGPGKGHQ
jgi:hypothetical protein